MLVQLGDGDRMPRSFVQRAYNPGINVSASRVANLWILNLLVCDRPEIERTLLVIERRMPGPTVQTFPPKSDTRATLLILRPVTSLTLDVGLLRVGLIVAVSGLTLLRRLLHDRPSADPDELRFLFRKIPYCPLDPFPVAGVRVNELQPFELEGFGRHPLIDASARNPSMELSLIPSVDFFAPLVASIGLSLSGSVGRPFLARLTSIKYAANTEVCCQSSRIRSAHIWYTSAAV